MGVWHFLSLKDFQMFLEFMTLSRFVYFFAFTFFLFYDWAFVFPLVMKDIEAQEIEDSHRMKIASWFKIASSLLDQKILLKPC